MLWLLLLVAAPIIAAIAASGPITPGPLAGSSSPFALASTRPALSVDCSRLDLLSWTESELVAWLESALSPAYMAARSGSARVRFVVVGDGLGEREQLVDPADPEAVAASLYQALAGSPCAVLAYAASGGLLHPSDAAACLYLRLELAARAQLAVDLGRTDLGPPPSLVEAAAAACAWPQGVTLEQLSRGDVTGLALFRGPRAA
jgi:hypothetical protein